MDDFKLTWDVLREQARNQNDLTDSQKDESVLAFDILENFFGTTFFDKKHPLFWFFFDRSGWRCEWAIWFAQFLKSLETHPDFPFLIRALKDPESFDERMTVLKIAEFLSLPGFIFRFDSPTRINGVQKEPDLFVQLSSVDPGFFIEVSRLGRSEKQREADEAFDQLFGLHVFWPLEKCCGRLERTPAPLRLTEVKDQIQNLVNKAREQNSFEALEIPGLVQFAYAAESHMEKLQNWADIRGLKVGQLSGPSVNIDEFERISNKLKDKIKQVPADRANVIVLYSHLFSMPPRETSEFATFVHALENIVYRHGHIGYLILIFSWAGGNENEVIRYRDHICVNRQWLYFNCSSIMLIRNRFAAQPMPQAVEERFLRAFMVSL